MLARVAARSLRPHGPQVQNLLPHSFSRSYAKYNKPKRPSDDRPHPNYEPTNRHGPDVQRPSRPVAAASRPPYDAPVSESNHRSSNPTPQDPSASEPGDLPYAQRPPRPVAAAFRLTVDASASESNYQSSNPAQRGPSASESRESYHPNTVKPTESNTNAENSIPQNEFKKEQNFRPLPDLTRGIPSTLDYESSNPTPQGHSLFESRESSRPDTAEPTESNTNAENSIPQNEFNKEQNFRPLPDLTRGIPSTLDYEMAEAASAARADSKALDIAEDTSQSAGGRGGGDLPKTEYISSIERRKSRVARYMYAGFLGFSIVGTIYLGRNWDTEEEERMHLDAPSGWGFGLFYNRASARLRDILDYYNEPSFTKLLPDPDPAWARQYTLVLSLEDLMIHSEWTREHGWRMAKRPGVDYFLRYLSQYYELVIFTSVPVMIGDQIIRKLDPFRVVMWPLFREATRFKQGQYIKDLSFLNRDLSKVIMIDTVAAHAKMQPENAIILPKWKGDLQDKELVSLIPFLEYLATMDFDDTRKVLKSFEGKHIPTEFAHREAIARERFEKELAEERAKRPRRSGVGLLGSALGIKPMSGGLDGMDHGFSRGFDEGKTVQDQIRERGQMNYEIFEKEIRENGEKLLQEMEQEEKKMRGEAMKGWKSSLLGPFGGSREGS